MPRGGARPGAGRPPGRPNKLTSAARSAFMATFGELEGDLRGWLEATAKGDVREVEQPDGSKKVVVLRAPDPARAADILVRMAEYHFPKLGRQELVGEGGGAIVFRMEDG